jgi:hypothetical protein
MKFAKVAGAPYSDADIQVIGPALLAIAKAHKVGHIRCLSRKIALQAVEADKKHPLWGYLERDVGKAARQHWLAQLGNMIRSVREVGVSAGVDRTPPIFVTVNEMDVGMGVGALSQRRQVVLADLTDGSVEYASAVQGRVLAVWGAVRGLESIVAGRTAPRGVGQLVKALRAALEVYG